MVLHAFIDDSNSDEPSVRKAYVLGGYLATHERWARFAEEWASLLEPFDIPRDRSGRRRFRMSEMAHRIRDVRAFYETIVRHALGAVSIVLYEDDLERARSRIRRDNAEILFSPHDEGKHLIKKILLEQLYGMMDDASVLLTARGTNGFGRMLSENRDRIETYFDKDDGEPWMADWWEGFIQGPIDPGVLGTQGPQFVDYLPLQAADFWAWWARQAYEKGNFQELASGNFGAWQGSNSPPILALDSSEDDLADYLMESFQRSSKFAGTNVHDAKNEPRA